MAGSGLQCMFLVILMIGLSTFDLCCLTSHADVNQGLSDLQEYLDNRLEMFRADVHRSFQQQHQRIRREAGEDLAGDLEGQAPLPTDNATVLEHFIVGSQVYVIVGRKQSANGSYRSTARIHRFDGTYNITDEIPTNGVSDIEAFTLGGHTYIAVANQIEDPGLYDVTSKIFRFDSVMESIMQVQQILTSGAADFEFFEFQGDGYLALANMRTDGYDKYRAEMQVYVFSGAHFDLATSVETYGATAVAAFVMEWEPYIAVAQYVNNEGEYDVGSIIYKFDTSTDTLTKVHTLHTSAPKDIEAFYMNDNLYLAVANYQEERRDGVIDNHTDSVIYWWTGLQFVEYQRIPTQGASQWEAIELPNGEILLALSSLQGVTVYEFNTDAEWVPTSEQATDVPSIKGTAVIQGIEGPSGMFMLVVDSQSTSSDYENGTSNVIQVVATDSSQVETVDAIPACLRAVESRIDSLAASLEELNTKLEGALKVDGEQNVISRVVFNGSVVVEKLLRVENLTVMDEYSFKMDEAIIEDGIKIDKELANLPEEDDIVTISGAQTVESALLFKRLLLSENTTVTNTTTNRGLLNGIDIKNLNDTLVRLSGDQTIDGNAIFKEDVKISQSHLNVQGDINGKDIPGDVMTIEGTQTVWGFLTFTNTTTFAGNITVDGLVNGLNLSEDVVTTHLDHVVGGTKTVSEDMVMNQDGLVADGMTVDTVDLSSFKSLAVSVSQGGEVSGVITLQGRVNIDGQLHTDLIDGVNITELNNTAVFKHTTQTIYDNKLFARDFTALSDLDVDGEINGVPVSEFVLLDIPGQPIYTPVRFAKNVSVKGNMEVNGLLNGINVSEEVVTIAGSQDISGNVRFTQDISVVGDIEIKENVALAGVDISELPSETISISSSTLQTMNGVKTFTETVDVQSNITVGQLISGVNLTELQQQILSLTRPQVIDYPIEVRGWLVVRGNLQLVGGVIDGYRISRDFVQLDKESLIDGDKIFKEFLDIDGNLMMDSGTRVSGVDLPDLDRRIIKLDAVQTIDGDVVIKNDVVMKEDLVIDGLLNGLDIPDDIVTLSGDQNIDGDIKFESVVVSADVQTSHLNVSGEVNTVNLDELFSSAVMTRGEEVSILTPVTFDQLEVNNQLLVMGTVDGVDINEFAANVVTLSGDQTINGTLEFMSDVDFSQNLTVDQNVSGIDFNSFISSVVLKDTDGPIYGQKTFASNVSVVGHVMVDNLVNGVNLEILNQTYLSRTINQTLNELKTFLGNISVDDILFSPGAHVNGIRPSTDLVLLSTGESTINGTVWFSSFLEVDGNVTISKTINDLDLVEFNNSVVWLFGPEQTITGHWTLSGGMHVIGDIAMEEFMEVNGVDVSELEDSPVSSHGDMTFMNHTVFTGPVIGDGNLKVLGLIDGVDLEFILKDAVMSGSEQTISGAKDFTRNVTAQHLEVETDMVSEVISGTANLTYLLDNTVLKSTDQEVAGTVVFTEDVVFREHLIVSGLIEGVDLSEQAVLKHTDQELTGANIFQNGFRVEGDITAGLVDLVDVPLLAQSGLFLIDTYQVIQGAWSFHNNVTVYGDISVNGTVSGIDINETVVTVTGAHEITGRKTFSNFVEIQGDLLVGLVNGVNLTEFAQEIVHLVGDYTITGDKVFAGNVTLLANATVLGLVNGIDVNQMYYDHQDTAQRLYWEIAQLNDTLRSMCPCIASLQMAAQAQAVNLSYWEEEFQLNNTFATYQYDSLHVEGGLLVAFTESREADVDDCVWTKLYLCLDDNELECVEAYGEPLSAASSVELFLFEEEIFIVLGLSKQSPPCTNIPAADNEVQILKMSNATFDLRLPAQHAVDSAMFVINGTLYLAVANHYNPLTGNTNTPSVIYEYDPAVESFTELQQVSTKGSTAVTFLEHDGNSWLAFTSNTGTTYSFILVWNATINEFVLEASILTYSAMDVLGLVIDDVPYILFANKKAPTRHGTVNFYQPISVYGYSAHLGWTLKQDIESKGMIHLEAFLIDKICYLVGVSSRGFIDIYMWSGVSLFQFCMSMPMEGVAAVHPFVQWGDLHMAVARPAFGSIIMEESRAFVRAVIRGQNENTVLEVV